MTTQTPKTHVIEFEGVRLPAVASFLEIASKILKLPDETDEWFWRFTICAGRRREAEASVVTHHARALLDALPSSVTPIADELRQRFPDCEPARILDEWRTSLQQIISLASERSICHWYGDDFESKRPSA
jgi:hypothetical protein